jgi:hypothetical protein
VTAHAWADDPEDIGQPPIAPFVDLAAISHDPPGDLLVGHLVPDGPTILFGQGGSGKGAVAASWIVDLVRDGRYVLVLDYEGNGQEWSRRIHSLDPFAHASGLIRYWTPNGPLHQVADSIRGWIEDESTEYLVVDSAGMAAGTDPLKPEAAINYAAALVTIGLPSLTLAHVTKAAGEAGRYPFGSVMWHNAARMTWNLRQDDSGNTILRHRKASNYPNQGAYDLTVEWRDGRLVEVTTEALSTTILSRVCLVLEDGPMTLETITQMVCGYGRPVTKDTIRRTILRVIGTRIRLSGALYSLGEV